ncbi:AraC family transcriptional regulator [Caulobacter sp. 17J80-11]|uniref:AraC family transcriptional regulator n=1 Tax=Caulobacter sp. 17J80-11 TaxID=2763502 RepID=UPI0016539C00|nr:AraC family transcriptional regulator [Caulobacter sp. 17J80-11]MBC6980359.1 AraC family transcriptional regulator [Caulobacter sp. 17J80-11]
MSLMVRADCARGFPALVRQLGGDPVRLLAEAHIDPAAIEDPRAFISHRGLVHALERAAVTLNCPDFGLRLAAEQDIDVLGPMAVAVGNAPTVGEALSFAGKYLYTHSPAVQLTLEPVAGTSRVAVKLELLLPRLGPHRQAIEAHVGLLGRILAVLSDGRLRPLGVTFRHRPLTTAHAQFFGAPVRFEASEDAVLITAEDLALPIRGRDAQLHEIAAGYLQATFPAPAGRLAAQVRALAERLLSVERCTHVEVAAALRLQPRTLQRRLKDEGASFEDLRDDARRGLALRYLAQPELPLSQVSALLGYAEPSAFTRSCRRWFGLSPRQLRADPGARAACA